MEKGKKFKKIAVIGLACMMLSGIAFAEQKRSADEVGKELSNPAGSLASLSLNFQYTDYAGDLPKADKQNSTAMIFQPILPFPLKEKGRSIIFRPAITVPFDQPVFNPAKGDFDTADVALADTGFDLFYAATVMEDKHNGFLWGAGMAGSLPTASENDLKSNQWRFGPEMFGGIIKKWGLVGVLANHQWNTGGSNNTTYSKTSAQYFYAIGLGNGWQLASGPTISYDWEADSDEALTIPIGFGVSKTTHIGNQPWKFEFQVQKFVVQPDSFSPDWLVKFTMTPVISNPFLKFF
jgi:hypothetical protein